MGSFILDLLMSTEKLGAQRFVNYWESRREVFGQEKFALRVTLSGALCDDLIAICSCFCRLLPHFESSGRQLLVLEPCHYTREGYTSESTVRSVVWPIVVQYFVVCTRLF
jgi:hypothetical protein